MSKNFLTREGYDKLILELQELKQEKLPAVLERLAEAKAMGDLSENFEYKSAMEDKDFINSRILEITNLIADVEIVENEIKAGGEHIGFGSKALIRFEEDGKEYRIQIVGTGEVAIGDVMKISFEDGIEDKEKKSSEGGPLGRALRGLKVGESATFYVSMPLPFEKDGKMTYAKDYTVTVLKIENGVNESRQEYLRKKMEQKEREKRR